MADGLSHNRNAALDTVTAQISGAHTDFPVLFTEANLPSEMFDSDGSFPAQNGGGDIRFTSDSAGNNDLPLEVVDFTTATDPANGTAQLWVKLPNVRGTQVDTVYVWYNTPSSDSQPAVTAPNGRNAVWSGFDAVYHLEESSSFVDSTGNEVAAGGSGSYSSQASAQIGDGVDFTDGEIDTGAALLSGVSASTIFAWVRWDGSSRVDEDSIASDWDSGSDDNSHLFRYDSANGQLDFYTAQGTSTVGGGYAGTDIAGGAFHRVAARHDGSAMRVFKDGVKSSTSNVQSGTLNTATKTMLIGNTPHNATDEWRGVLDEVWFASQAFSDGWIATEHANQNDPGSFISVGTPQDVGGGGGLSIPVAMNHYRQMH